MSVGCSIGCKECDGGDPTVKSPPNPNNLDRCNSGMKATLNAPHLRTMNPDIPAGSDADWTKFNPWRAPGNAPVFDSCGRASGAGHPTGGHGEFTNTTFAKLGDKGSQVLPIYPSGAVWQTGSTVQTMWSVRANHGGGYQYRLCPLKTAEALRNSTSFRPLEDCFQQTPMPFAGDSYMMMSNGSMLNLTSTFVSEGTQPAGSTWQKMPIPMTRTWKGGIYSSGDILGYQFEPPCYDPTPPAALGQGICTGEWIVNITLYDQLRVPDHLEPGDYVLGFRWDCESSAQVWQSCADITITK